MLRKLVIAAMPWPPLCGCAFWFFTMPQTIPASALAPHTPNLANGRTMFLIGGCSSCHAVPGAGKTPPGSVAAWRSIRRSACSTCRTFRPTPRMASARWSEAQFVTAMVKGTSPAGEHLYPALPYTSYQRMRLDDLRDLFAYLKTLPAIRGQRARPRLAVSVQHPPGSRGCGSCCFSTASRSQPDPAQSAQWNRGAYLVEWPRPLRRMSFAAKFSGRNHR